MNEPTHIPPTLYVRPPILCLCGSTRFKEEFEVVNMQATLTGAIVLAPGVFFHADKIQLSDQQKAELDAIHLKKIDMADVVWVVARGGYIGESTKRHIEYAGRAGKPVVMRASGLFENGPKRR